MFIKKLTPRDVGKLDSMVIPKKHATQYFPQVASETAQVQVEFVDREARRWTFRCCYWKSSQSFVFTTGWNKFVKEKKLQAKDAVAFYRCQEREGLQKAYCLIDAIRCNDGGQCHSTGNKSASRSANLKRKIEQIRDEEEKAAVLSPEKSVKLFGARIS